MGRSTNEDPLEQKLLFHFTIVICDVNIKWSVGDNAFIIVTGFNFCLLEVVQNY